MSAAELGLLAIGALVAGLVAGLTGFGAALVALGIWLQTFDPRLAVPLAAIIGAAAHIYAVAAAGRVSAPKRSVALIVFGLAGVPLGALLLTALDPGLFKRATGIFILLMAALLAIAHLLAARRQQTAQTAAPAAAGNQSARPRGSGTVTLGVLGFIGGILGGVLGLSGALPAAWGQLMGWDKAFHRGLFQVFNIAILFLTISLHIWNGLITVAMLPLIALVVPPTLLGTWIGSRLFQIIGETTFRLVVLLMLSLSAARLVASG